MISITNITALIASRRISTRLCSFASTSMLQSQFDIGEDAVEGHKVGLRATDHLEHAPQSVPTIRPYQLPGFLAGPRMAPMLVLFSVQMYSMSSPSMSMARVSTVNGFS